MQSEMPDVVLPEPILPPALAFELGREAEDDAFWDAYDAYLESCAADSESVEDPGDPHPVGEPIAYLLHEAAKSPERAAVLRAAIVQARDASARAEGEFGEHAAQLEILDRFLTTAVYA